MSIFTNPLASPRQLSSSPSQSDGISSSLESSLTTAAARLIQSAGILLSLPQPAIATAIILWQRFHLISSIRQYPIKDTVQAVLFLSGKLTEYAQKPRDIVNVITYLLSSASPLTRPTSKTTETRKSRFAAEGKGVQDEGFYVSESEYYSARTTILQLETRILRSLGFQTHVALPYTLAFNYLQALDVLHHTSPILKKIYTDTDTNTANLQPRQHPLLISTTFAYLTDALQSSHLPYLTHHPHELAVAAIYLAARDHECKLPEGWWEVWDVEREVLGFLVVIMRGGCYEGGQMWLGGKDIPVTGEELEEELARRREAELEE